MRKEEILRKINTKRAFVLKVIKRQLIFQRRIIRKECFENLALISHTECKKDREKHRVIYLTSLCKWTVAGNESM